MFNHPFFERHARPEPLVPRAPLYCRDSFVRGGRTYTFAPVRFARAYHLSWRQEQAELDLLIAYFPAGLFPRMRPHLILKRDGQELHEDFVLDPALIPGDFAPSVLTALRDLSEEHVEFSAALEAEWAIERAAREARAIAF
jgi:hypothetical protein